MAAASANWTAELVPLLHDATRFPGIAHGFGTAA